jgi:hypothetical protein
MKRLVSPIIDYFTKNNLCRDYTAIQGERSIQVTLQFPTINTQQSYYFAPNPVLDGENAIITSIQLVNAAELSVNNVGQTNLLNSVEAGVLYISNLKRSVIATLPLTILNRQDGSYGTYGKPCWTWFTDHVWQNCYVEFTNNSFVTAGNVATFQIYYVPRVADKNK